MLPRLLPALLFLAAATPAAGADADAARMFQALPTPASACGTPLAATGKAVTWREPLDETTRKGLLAGVHLALREPAEVGWAAKDVQAARDCPIARFAANELIWTIHSGAGGAPLRVIANSTREDAFVLVKGPSIAEAAAWHGARRGAVPPFSAYYLFAKLERMHYLVKLYDGPPAMEAVAEDIGRLMENEAATLAFYEASGGTVNLNLPTATGPQAELFQPENLTEGRFAALYQADGRFVTLNDQGDFVLRGSGFRCRPAFGPAKRARVTVSDPSDETLDMGCLIETDESLTTVFVTRIADTSQDRADFERKIRAVEEETGVVRKLTNPRTGPKGPIRAGRNWIDKEGQVQVAFFMREGDYVYEIRQTHPLEELDAAGQTLVAVADQIGGADAESRPAPAAAKPENRLPESWRRP